MDKAFYVELLKSLALKWAKSQGATRLRKFAASPEPDIHVAWKIIKFKANAWVTMAPFNPAPGSGWKLLAKVTVEGERFLIWWAKA
jgi:hypothetical protein